MTTNQREKDFPAKKEGNINEGKIIKASSSSRPWSGPKDPRIVHVSRSFGGKDRHSKVCTIRGLRDRRVRLSVPTAIQLYDLQDRLGLNQPSKVVDWLLNAAKHEIDELPPLQMPPGIFSQYPQSMVVSHEVNAPESSLASLVGANTEYVKDGGALSLLSSKGGLNINNNVDGENQFILPKSTYWNSDAHSRMKCSEVARETIAEKSNWMKRNEQENQEGIEGYGAQVSAHNSCPRGNNSSVSSMLNNVIPYNSNNHWEPSNLSLSHLGYSSQMEDPRLYNVVSLPSSLSQPSGSQLLVCPSGTAPSLFPPYVTTPLEYDPRHINHFQMLSSSSQNLLPTPLTPSIYSISPPMRPFLSATPKILHSQRSNGSQPNKDNSGTSSTHTANFFENDSKAMLG